MSHFYFALAKRQFSVLLAREDCGEGVSMRESEWEIPFRCQWVFCHQLSYTMEWSVWGIEGLNILYSLLCFSCYSTEEKTGTRSFWYLSTQMVHFPINLTHEKKFSHFFYLHGKEVGWKHSLIIHQPFAERLPTPSRIKFYGPLTMAIRELVSESPVGNEPKEMAISHQFLVE